MSDTHFTLTTTLPYVNAKPHIGHALEFIQADVIVRYQRQQGKKVLFNVGTDEHGLKMYQKAQEQEMDVQDFVDANVETFTQFCEDFGISYDSFYRTSDPSHIRVAQTLRQACQDAGDIYEKVYEGKYCVGCERFLTDKELVDGNCPDHGVPPIDYRENNYFFSLSKYKDHLLAYLENTHFVKPASKENELRNILENLQDISISRLRENLPWGVPVPGDESQVMYVWFDALSNYIGAVGYPEDMTTFDAYRGSQTPQAVQLCGPDNLRFQAAIWQGMLASAGLAHTQTLIVHGMILGPDGNKMSKTLGNTIDPMQQLQQYGAQAVRYYLIAGIPTMSDASYIQDDLVNLYNSHLANSFGNLLNRTVHLATKKGVTLDQSQIDDEVQEYLSNQKQRLNDAYEQYDLYGACGIVHEIALYANEYFSNHEPWSKEKSPDEVSHTLNTTTALLQSIIDGYTPVIPDACAQAQQMLNSQTKGILFEKLTVAGE